jgi:hypothetical protein
MIDLHRGPEMAVMLQHVAGANLVSVDLGHWVKPWQKVDMRMPAPISRGVKGGKTSRFRFGDIKAMRIAHVCYASALYPNRSKAVISALTPKTQEQ